MFLILCHLREDFGVDAEWHFFATAHGKSACDELGSTVKRLAAKASLQRPPQNQILTPRQLYDFDLIILHVFRLLKAIGEITTISTSYAPFALLTPSRRHFTLIGAHQLGCIIMYFCSSDKQRQWLAAFIISISGFIIGTSLGWPSPVLASMKKTGEPLNMTRTEISWMVSLLYAGNLVSPFPTGWAMDTFGRKFSLVLLSAVPILSWLFCIYPINAYFLCVSRLLAGCWSGVSFTIIPIYLGEISEAKIRGATGTLVQIMINLGIIFEFVSGRFFSYYTLTIMSAVFPLIFMITLCFIPESYYWLIEKSKTDKAIKSLAWFKGTFEQEVQGEIEQLQIKIKETTKPAFYEIFSTPARRKAIMMVLFSAFIQRMSGVSCYCVFASTTLPDIKGLTASDSTIILGFVSLLSLFVAVFVVDTCDRKKLLIVSCIGCGICNFISGLWFLLFHLKVDVANVNWIPIITFSAYFIMFNVGLGSVPGILQGETLPPEFKAYASAVTSSVLAITSFLTNKMYHPIEEEIGVYMNYWIFSLSCILSIVIVHCFFIETKGKTLLEVQLALQTIKK